MIYCVMSYEIVIGLEIHVKMNSRTWLFCRCKNVQDFDQLIPNTHICPICTWQPGALPVLQKEPIEKAIALWLVLWCTVQEISRFDRKSYFYPDLPTWYQITQQYMPTNIDGEVSFFVDKEFTQVHTVRIHNAHIEIDTGKTSKQGSYALIDYNRSGTPLVEIVTEPDFRSADQVIWFLQELQRRVRYNALSDAEMEKWQMRCDVNISLRQEGADVYNTRVELKNMSSFSAVRRAIDHEVQRQTALYDAGNDIAQETRWRDDAQGESYVMRSKEDAMDYRYMPEPDLPDLRIEQKWIDAIATQIVESPFARITRYKQDYWFNKEYINWLISDKEVNAYFETCVAQWTKPKETAKWIVGPVARWCGEQEKTIGELLFSQESFVSFLGLLTSGDLINQHAKTVMKDMLLTGKAPQVIMEEKNLKPVDEGQVKIWIEEIFTDKPDLLEDLKSGNMKPMGFVVGQVMKKSAGSADPQMINSLLKEMF